jgi:methyl-accepting chemotaxis protein
MHATVLDVRRGVQDMREATSQITNGTQELSGRTVNQAGHIEQNAVAIEEISNTVKQTANAARQASQFSQAACAAADSGGKVVGEVITTMNSITQSSKKIAEIIGLIDSIAFQTNILALNAAVEAARAGENGRGFAVVAGEVRSLAQRSAKSAQEIKTLISTSSEQVNRGSALVNAAGKTIGDVVAQVRRVAELVGSIADASIDQATGVGEISASVGQLDVMTQQNASLVQKNTLFAASLRTQSESLAQAVGVFRLSESESLELFNATQTTAEEGAVRSLHTRAA